MNLTVIKGLSTAMLGTAFAIYAAIIFGHLFIEYSFSRGTLHTQDSLIRKIPGSQILVDEKTVFCVDEAVAGRAVGPDTWTEKYCDTGPARRITVYSRYMRKYWILYIDEESTVTFKSSQVIL